jgi:signal transduction histidine kinase
MKIFGIDFTSAPSPQKPITVAEGEFLKGTLTIQEIHALTSFPEFEGFLEQKGPWVAGIDFPFGLPGAFLSTLGLPHNWQDYVEKLSRRPRSEFENKIKSFKSKQPSPFKEPLRFTDVLASAQSPLKLVNAPVAKMFYEGSHRILKSGASIIPCRRNKTNRTILEAYPALVARRFAPSYKTETKDTPSKKSARKNIIAGILGRALKTEFGFSLKINTAIKDQLLKDTKGDRLDAVLCSLQTAWAYSQASSGYGVPKSSKSLLRSEGWIIDPSLHLDDSDRHKKSKPTTYSAEISKKIENTEKDSRIVRNLLEKLKKLTDIGLALSRERNLDILLEMIMDEARAFTNADGGTLYILENEKLHFKIFQNDTLDIRMGGNHKSAIPFPPLELEASNVSSHVALTGLTINIPEVSKHTEHSFSGPRLFDQKFNYRTQSMLLVPMKNQEEEIIGVIQLLNARKPGSARQVIPFSHENVRWIQSLASQAAVAITNVSLVEENRKVYSQVATARDMALEANAAKSKFLANMTHELRTPMNAIIGYTEMLLEETTEQNLQEIHKDLEKIGSSAKILLRLINDILDLSKIDAGKMEIQLKSFKIQEVIQTAIQTIEPIVQKTNNSLNLQCDENLGFMVADMDWVRQILINLLSNACKFTENGQITLNVIRVKRDNNPWVIFTITDTGIGIHPENLRSIFSEFTQADSSINRKFGGTGLGLAISLRFCRMMGGNITVKSKLKKGTIFTVQLPAKVIPFTPPPKRRASDLV